MEKRSAIWKYFVFEEEGLFGRVARVVDDGELKDDKRCGNRSSLSK